MTTANDAEEWRPIAGFPGYEVSSLGRVRSWRRTGVRGAARLIPADEPSLLTVALGPTGYMQVDLQSKGRSRRKRVHRLVLAAFVGAPPPGMTDGCHGDGDRTNNRLENLRWDTRRGNMADTVAHGTRLRGQALRQSVLSESQVLEIHEALNAGRSRMALADEYGVSYGAIHGIWSGMNWGWLTGRAA